MNWYFADGKNPIGPIDETEFDRLAIEGRIGPDTLVWHDGMDAWRPRRAVAPAPEATPLAARAPQFPVETAMPDSSDPRAYADAILSNKGAIEVWACIGRAWELVFHNFGRIFCATGLILLARFLIVVLTANLSSARFLEPILLGLTGPLFGGLYLFYLKLIRSEKTVVKDALSGFGKSFKQLMLNGILTSMISFLFLMPYRVAVSDVRQSINIEKLSELRHQIETQQIDLEKVSELENEIGVTKILRVFVFLCIWLLVVAYLGFVWVFSLPLTIDKGMKFWPAMEVSRRVVNHHAWSLALLLFVASVIAIAGLLLFGIGVFITIPISIAAVMFAYEGIFSAPSVERC